MTVHDYETHHFTCTTEEFQEMLHRLRDGRDPPVADKPLPSVPVSHSPRRALPVQPNNGIIYAIVDLKADAIVGGLQLHRADASAIRTFGDIASDDKTTISKHVEDYELRRLGYIDEHNSIFSENDTPVVISGAQWKAAQSLKLTED